MTQPLVLSLFPGIGLLDMAFEEEGFCVVRGPDLLWGGDVRRFHPPAGRFEGIIGGPPCKRWSRLAHMVVANGYGLAEDLIPEYCRVVAGAGPAWFLMENVPAAPLPEVPGYVVHSSEVRDDWFGGLTIRKRRFSFGTAEGQRLPLRPEQRTTWEPAHAVLAGNSRPVPVQGLKGGKRKRTAELNRGSTAATRFEEAKRLSGLPPDLDLPPFTASAKCEAVGNGVPLRMGRAVARAVKRAMYPDSEAA